jgi:hypothetical protein
MLKGEVWYLPPQFVCNLINQLPGVAVSPVVMDWPWPWPLAVTAIVLGTMAVGGMYGFLITRVRLQPFIVTLCGLLVYRGLARFIADDEAKGFGNEGFGILRELATGTVFGVPMPFVVLVVIAVIMWVVLHRSVYGRHLFAVGRNEDAARYSGINSRRVIGGADGHRGHPHRLLHEFHFAVRTRQFLRALRHCGGRSGGLQLPRGRRVGHRHRHRHGAPPGAAEPREPAGDTVVAQLRRHGRRYPGWRPRGPDPDAAAAAAPREGLKSQI